jgi:hypothetical protein
VCLEAAKALKTAENLEEVEEELWNEENGMIIQKIINFVPKNATRGVDWTAKQLFVRIQSQEFKDILKSCTYLYT